MVGILFIHQRHLERLDALVDVVGRLQAQNATGDRAGEIEVAEQVEEVGVAGVGEGEVGLALLLEHDALTILGRHVAFGF